MRGVVLALTLLAAVIGAQESHALATETKGPQEAVPQTSWPVGLETVPSHGSRVYSLWINGNESFHFDANVDEMNELLRLYAAVRMRDHEVWIKEGPTSTKPFEGDRISANVMLNVTDGIALAVTRGAQEPNTARIALTLFVKSDEEFAALRFPKNLIVHSDGGYTGETAPPPRKTYHAQVNFDDGTPASDGAHSIRTAITLWEKNERTGIKLGSVNRDGQVHILLSSTELSNLRSGLTWITFTVGTWSTETKRDHPRLELAKLTLSPLNMTSHILPKPIFYHGRILFEDGSPPKLNPPPWPGADIGVDFRYMGQAQLEEDGSFKVFLTPEQFEATKTEEERKNIYVPSYEQHGHSRAEHIYPASMLSLNKTEAGVVRIPKPGPKK
jgi:hypothetical protein